MAAKTIGEVARGTGLRASALRYYEAEGLVPSAGRRGGKRVYDEAALDRLALVELAKASGFTVAEVRKLLGGFDRRTPPGERWRSLAKGKIAALDARIAEARRMKRVLEIVSRCDCPTLAECGRAMRSRPENRPRTPRSGKPPGGDAGPRGR